MTGFDQAKVKAARAYRYLLVARVMLEQGKCSGNGAVDRASIDQAIRYLDHARNEVDRVAVELGVGTEWWMSGEA